jgi:CRISPR/Cas system-associated exonuclease Cas4 (RecB family)
MGFLDKVAKTYLDELGNDIHHVAFVFPTRRARLYFLRHLQQQKTAGTSIWAPPIFSLNDFIAEMSGITVSDPMDLIFELFSIYRNYVRSYPREFEDFYPWGKMILSDFDEIDKYLIDTGELFRNLENFKDIEKINEAEKSDIYKRYTGFWGGLGTLYGEFKAMLKEKNKAYEGLIYREVAENINTLDSPEAHLSFPWKKVVFCGFNALTSAEETIIQYLLESDRADIYWDMDHYFVDDDSQEAGLFFRKNRNLAKQEDALWVDYNMLQTKHIDIIGVQSRTSQAKVLGLKLQELQQQQTDPQHIAVVLPDETLLFPTLNSLPEAIKEVNVTIGFPLQQTPIFSLFEAVIEMQLRMLEKGADFDGFYYKDVQKVLNHPYIKPLATDEITVFLGAIKKENRIYIKKEDVQLTSEILRGIFELRTNSDRLMDFFLDLLDEVRRYYQEHKPDLFPVDYEYMYHFYTLMSRLKDSLRNTGLELKIHAFRQLFIDIMMTSRIPFTGEPLVGLQIMGMLETQTLDFQHLFVLSVNEGHLPPGKAQQSFIPYDVRIMMGLPTYKERDAIAAYHFYRLLKNSVNITLLYVTEAKGIDKSEKSRFIDQLLIEYAERNKNARIRNHVIDFSFDTGGVKKIAIDKTPATIDILAAKSYSASSLLTYLTCPLKFYFNYVLKLQEEEEVYESPDHRVIGNIVHNSLLKLYAPYRKKGGPIAATDIDDIKKRLERVLTEEYMKELKTDNPRDIETGRNRIAVEVMSRFLDHFFEKEKQRAGFSVLMLERKIKGIELALTANGVEHTVQLEGTIDRVEMNSDGVYGIIDYKTGRIGSLKLPAVDELEPVLIGQEAVNRKEVFQLLFYRYLVQRIGAYSGEFRLGIYPFKKIYDKLKYVTIGKNDILPDELPTAFEKILKGIFRQIFDKDAAFSQTEEEKNCRYCPYKTICNREAAPEYGR